MNETTFFEKGGLARFDEAPLTFAVTVDSRTLATLVVALVDAHKPITAVKLVKEALHASLGPAKGIVDVARNSARWLDTSTVITNVADAIESYCGA